MALGHATVCGGSQFFLEFLFTQGALSLIQKRRFAQNKCRPYSSYLTKKKEQQNTMVGRKGWCAPVVACLFVLGRTTVSKYKERLDSILMHKRYLYFGSEC